MDYVDEIKRIFKICSIKEADNTDFVCVREIVEKMERKKIIEQHSYKITQGKDGYWRTYVKDSTKNSGCRLIKKSTKKKLLDELVKYYKKIDNKPTFKDCYFQWRDVQDKLVEGNTIYKYNTDYRRFFEGNAFEGLRMENITEDKLKIFFHESIKQNGLTKGAFKKLFGYVNNTFDRAYRDKIIIENPMSYFKCKEFYKLCEEVEKPLVKQVFSDKEIKQILDKLHEQYETQPDYIPNYAVEFAYLTGMRVGEIVALRWDNVNFDEGYFLINMSEKYNRITKEISISTTKNKKARKFPIDEAIQDLLYRIMDIQFEYNINGDWIFANACGRIHASVVSSCIKNKCKQLGIPEKGIHAFRKTFNSNIRCSGVSEVVAASLLGHSPQVNRDYYTFDVTSMKAKLNIVSQLHACGV